MSTKKNWGAGILSLLVGAQLALFADETSSNKNSYMIPTGRVILAPDDFADDIAVSSLVEFGPRNGRIGGTIAFQLDPCNRFKLSGEYLGQKLTWSFSSGKESHWAQQAAFGADYQLLVDKDCLRALDFRAYTSYAPSKDLHSRISEETGSRFFRRIAGSNAWGAVIGTVWTVGCEDLFNIDLDWDHVRYKRKFSREKTVSGLGGSIIYTHRFPCCIDLSLEGQFRRPFNYLGGKLNWNSAMNDPHLSVALFGGHTRGKMKLPSSTVVGLELSYAFAICQPRERECCPPLWNPCDIVTWAMDPAVYMPEVLAISEERHCRRPTLTSAIIPNMIYDTTNLTPDTIPLAQYFSSTEGPLTFSITTVNQPEFIVVTIDPNTGVLSYSHPTTNDNGNFGAGFNVIVTATSRCGSVSQSFVMVPST